MSPKAAKLVRQILAILRPPEDLLLADWMTRNITLPEGKSVRPGPMENWPYMTEILNAMGDRGVERVTVMKSARLGYTTGLMGVLAATSAMDPGPIILLMPTDDDARGISVDWVEPLFRSNAVLRGLMRFGRLDGRNTLVMKAFNAGGSLKILAAGIA
jgi:phage terminase large subunit GpA-like protein